MRLTPMQRTYENEIDLILKRIIIIEWRTGNEFFFQALTLISLVTEILTATKTWKNVFSVFTICFYINFVKEKTDSRIMIRDE